MDKQSGVWDALSFTILLPLLSVGCSLGINYQYATIGLIPTVLVLLIIVVAVPIAIYWANSIYSHVSLGYLEKQIDTEIKSIQSRISNGKIMNGICKEEQLALMERTCTFEEIWLISPDLLTEINSGIYAGVVRDNLKKGTKYKYFVPNTEINKVRVEIFKKNCGNNANLQIYYLTDDFFFLVPKVDFAIYEPMKSITDGKKGYMGLPIEGTDECFAVLMNNDFVDAVIGKLAERINAQ